MGQTQASDGGEEARLKKLAKEAGIEHLAAGMNYDEAERLWALYDTDGNGELDRDEAKQLVNAIAEQTIAQLEDKITSLREAMKDPGVVDEFMQSFDLFKDGKVSKIEFVSKAIVGYELPDRPRKRARIETADGPTQGSAGQAAGAHRCG